MSLGRLFELAKELEKTQRKLRKADHDRQRYKKRIRFLDLRHQMLCRDFHALQRENEILSRSLTEVEKRLMMNGGTKARS